MGPANQSDRAEHPLYYSVRRKHTLYKAWAQVRENGLASSSKQTRNEVGDFSLRAEIAIPSISERLRKRTFIFEPSRGILLSKGNKSSKRPVVVAPVISRVVQRALLDVVQQIPTVRSVLHAGYNFGGIDGKGFGVPAAVEKSLLCAQTYGYFIRSDIKSFFTAVPRDIALARLGEAIHDSAFLGLLKAATDTELANAAKFNGDLHLFPLGDMGVAQGSSLSPLLCNYLLKDFDEAMNARGVTCIRYIDDFILFSRDKQTAFKAMKSALARLKVLGLEAYNPLATSPDERDKTEHGFTKDGFNFLGCSVRPDRVRPSTTNYKEMLDSVSESFEEALKGLNNPKEAIATHTCYSDALSAAGNIVRGWGNTFSFCSDDQLMSNLDLELNKRFEAFNLKVRKRLRHLDALNRRRYLGFHCLQDCKREANDVGIRGLVASYRAKGPASKVENLHAVEGAVVSIAEA